jgi:hypothetical protein
MRWPPRRRAQAIDHIRAEAAPAQVTGDHHRQLAKSLLAQDVGGIRLLVDVDHFKGQSPALHGSPGGMALHAVISSVNNNAHDSYFHLR